MTRPHEGDAFIGVHADTSPYEREVGPAIQRASDRVEDTTLKKVGKDFGDTVSKSMGTELEKNGPELGKSVEKGLGRTTIRARIRMLFDRDRNAARRLAQNLTEDVEKAFDKAASPGGPFSRIGTGIADAIGAGFNVSGRSSLIIFLIPLIGVIVALVLAAVQAANALVAVLATVPALIAAIGLQVGVLMLAFKGVGTAIQGAFAAKNAKELNEALKDLTPSAQKFVRELLPLRGLFKTLQEGAQEAFFSTLGSVIPQIAASLGKTLINGFIDLAVALGELLRSVGLFFASPTFKEFVQKLFPATIDFLRTFGPAFITFLTGLVKLSTAILPFLTKIGMMVGGTLTQLGEFFDRLSRSATFPDFLKSMQKTLELILELAGGVVDFFAVLFAQLDAAGGKDVLQSLIDAIALLTFFLSTDVGKKGLEGLIHLAILSVQAFTGIILAILLVAGALEAFAEFLTNTVIPAIGEFFKWLGGQIVAFFTMIGVALETFFNILFKAVADGWNKLTGFFANLAHTIASSVGGIVEEARNLPSRILSALGDMLNLLHQAGRNLIQGFINGVKSMLGPLTNIISAAAQVVRDHWPFSPAKTGPLSGSGDPMIAGQKTMQRFAEGIRMEIPTIQATSNEATSNIVFGRDAIRVTFEGALPTQEQATQTGGAVGAGINRQLAARDTRLAVRTL